MKHIAYKNPNYKFTLTQAVGVDPYWGYRRLLTSCSEGQEQETAMDYMLLFIVLIYMLVQPRGLVV